MAEIMNVIVIVHSLFLVSEGFTSWSLGRRRFMRGISNFLHLYQELLDSYLIFDNAGASPRLVAARFEDGPPIVLDSATFDTIKAEAHSR
jgi:hypothetical protein